jgi:hypothetical protein
MARSSELGADQRLERLIRDPDSIDLLWLTLSGPLYRLFNYQPRLQTKHIAAYVRAMAEPFGLEPDAGKLRAAADREFDENITSLERAYLLYGAVDPKLVNWAVRLHAVLARAARVAGRHRAHGRDVRTEAERRALQMTSHRALAPLLTTPEASATVRARVLSIESLLDAAQAETDFLGRRRHLLEAARELLLDSQAQIANREGIAPRLEHIAQEVGELDRLQAAAVKSDVSLWHQLGQARAERDTQRINAILSTLENQALARGDAPVAELTQGALAELWQGQDRFAPEHRTHSLARSGAEMFQPEVLSAARRGLLQAQEQYEVERLDEGKLKYGQFFDNVARKYLSQSPDTELVQSALYVDGCVDVGGVLSPQRVYEPVRVVREVRHPTQQLTLTTARGIDDMKEAVIADPRTLLMDMAADRLLARRYLGVETRHVERRVMSSEVRVFLLDGSGSMLGPRARMRDAILVAELSTMIARLNDADRWLTPTLYYRYFNQKLGPVVKVATAGEAIEAVEAVLGRLRHGGTDIEGALLGSFDTVREARMSSEDLARAQIVLITDGEAEVDEAAISKAREQVGDIPIGVSIIALGEENPALQALAARQRERGERVFYQFLGDDMLARLSKGESLGLSLHLPDALSKLAPSRALDQLLDEIGALRRERDDEALARVRDQRSALAEVGLELADLSKMEQARLLALSRDYDVLDERFARWFPRPPEHRPQVAVTLKPSDGDAELLEQVVAVLEAVADVTDLVGSEPHVKKADAIEMFERLLLERRLSFAHYQKLLERYPRKFDEALTSLYVVVDAPEPFA